MLSHVQEVQVKKDDCQRLGDRVVMITATVTAELMKGNLTTIIERYQSSVAALRRCVQILLVNFVC